MFNYTIFVEQLNIIVGNLVNNSWIQMSKRLNASDSYYTRMMYREN